MPVYNGRKLDWVPRHDPLSLNFLVSDAIPEQEERWRYWRPGANLDQGPDGACVGFGWTADLIGSPMPDFKVTPEIGNPYAFDLYHESQRNDQWAGEDYEGTSVLAGAKVVKSRGFISEYRWARGIEDVRNAVIGIGPVVLGIPVVESMFHPDSNGLLHLDGDEVGGHCIWLHGYNPEKRFPYRRDYKRVFRLRNSWGRGWGFYGDCFIEYDDLAQLLSNGGEACVPMGRTKVRLPFVA